MEKHAAALCADSGPSSGGPSPRLLLIRVMAISVGSAKRRRQLLLVSELALYLANPPPPTSSSSSSSASPSSSSSRIAAAAGATGEHPPLFLSALGITSISCGRGSNLIRIEVVHPRRQLVQLQTHDPLRVLTASRTWLSIAYLGTPRPLIGVRLTLPPDLSPPLPLITMEEDGGLARVLWPHLVLLLPSLDDPEVVRRLQATLGAAAASSSDFSSSSISFSSSLVAAVSANNEARALLSRSPAMHLALGEEDSTYIIPHPNSTSTSSSSSNSSSSLAL